jgi:hypothetical protein
MILAGMPGLTGVDGLRLIIRPELNDSDLSRSQSWELAEEGQLKAMSANSAFRSDFATAQPLK